MPCWVRERKAPIPLALLCQREDETPGVQQIFVRPPIDHERIPSYVVDHGAVELYRMIVDLDYPRHCWVFAKQGREELLWSLMVL